MSSEEAPITPLNAKVTAERPPAVPPPHRSAGSSEIILPRFVYIRDREGRYLTYLGNGPQYYNLTFGDGPPTIAAAFETTRAAASWYKLLCVNGRYVLRWHGSRPPVDWYSADPVDPTSVEAAFLVIVARDNIVYLKDNYFPNLYMSNELINGAPIARNFITENSEMEIIQAAVKSEIIDVQYNIDGAQVRSVAPLIALSTSIRNDSDGDVNQTLTYSYEKWSVGTWNNSAGVEIGAKMSFTAGVPFIASAGFEISISASYSHEWGGETGERETITSSTTVTVPPKKKANATIIVRNAQIDVGFTYTQRVLWSNGESEDKKLTGTYNNVDSWHVDVVLDNWEDV